MSPENSAQTLPLVSVICRSIGRTELQQALQSVNAQSYSNIEVVLVDAAGNGLGEAATYCPDLTLVEVADGKRRARSQAANAGLDASRGEYLMFLDDDDWLAPAHIHNLVTCLQQSSCQAAFSNTQKTDHKGNAVNYVFRNTYDPVLLMRDNYIPIHAMLFERTLLDNACRFDEAFDIYEDWDFWLQLNQHTDFAHVDEITAFYREGGESETAAVDTSARYGADTLLGKGRAAIFDKWLARWTGTQLNQLLGSLDKSAELQQLAADLHTARVDLDAAIDKQNQLQGELEQARQHLTNKEQQLNDLQQHAENQAQHINEISQTLHAIYNSPSWKLMGPFRRVHRSLKSTSGNKQRDD